MTKTKPTNQTITKRLKTVKLTPEVLEYLCGATKFGASRLGAYFSLLQCAVETTTPFTPLYGRSFNLEAGQLVISITDLSKTWEWARETVRKFLDQLETFKLLTKEQLDRCSLITMEIEWLDVEYTPVLTVSFPTFELPKDLSANMDRWLDGDIADEELAEAIINAVSTFENTDVNVSSYLIAEMQYALIRQLIEKRADSQTQLPIIPDDNSLAMLCHLHDNVLSGNWNLWLRVVREFSTGVSSSEASSATAKEPSFLSDGRAILDSLFTRLNVTFV